MTKRARGIPCSNMREFDAIMFGEPLRMEAPKENGTVILKRTFNMTIEGRTIRFWRILGPKSHPNLNSDLSIEGLRQWGVI